MAKYVSQFFRLLILGLIGILLLLSIFLAALQTEWGQKQVQNWIMKVAEKNDILFSIGSMEGTVPFNLTLHDVHIQSDPTSIVRIKNMKIRIAVFPLLRNELSISYASIPELTYLYISPKTISCFLTEDGEELPSLIEELFSLPFNFSIKSLKVYKFEMLNAETLENLKFSLTGQGKMKSKGRAFKIHFKAIPLSCLSSFVEFDIQGSRFHENIAASLNLDLDSTEMLERFYTFPFDVGMRLESFVEGPWNTWESLTTDHIFEKTSPLHGYFKGQFFHANSPDKDLFSLQGKGNVNDQSVFLEFSSQGYETYESLKGALHSTREGETWKGRISLEVKDPRLPIEARSDFIVGNDLSVTIKDLYVGNEEARLTGDLEMQFEPKCVQGHLFAQVEHLDQFKQFFPGIYLNGSAGLKIDLEDSPMQTIRAHGIIKNLSMNQLFASEATADIILFDLFGEPKGRFFLEGEKASLAQLSLSSFTFATHWDNHKWPFDFQAKGEWEDHLDIQGKGVWEEDTALKNICLQELSGFMLKKAFALEKPFSVSWNDQKLSVTDCVVKVAGGIFSLALDFSPTGSMARLKGERVPLDLISLCYPALSLQGTSSFDAYLDTSETNMQGRLNVLLEQARVFHFGKEEPVKAKGSLQAHLDNNILQIHTNLFATGDQVFDWTATLPVKYCLYPFDFHIDEESPLASHLVLEGNIEEIFDFINIGSHRGSGLLSCDLFLSKNLLSPSLKGTIELQGGTYENEYTGTMLKNVQSKLQAQHNTLELLSLNGKDKQGGSLTATGKWILDYKEKFPYTVHAELSNLRGINLDTLTSNFSGPIEIKGDISSAEGKGNLTVAEAIVEIPDELPPDIPVLPVTYINTSFQSKNNILAPPGLFPFHLDLSLDAPEHIPGHIRIRGRGLRSEWKGKAHLMGTNGSVAAKGSFSLLRGEFLFAGKAFSLTQGELTLVDKPTQSANLSLTGKVNINDITIIAILSGPLSSPQLTFQSMPHLPTSSILAHILFDKDISEISPLQALQLAQTLVTLSGGAAPDVLEKIRRGLGVDRLNIVSCQDEITVQIGKYLTRGVMVTLVQGPDSSQVIVEVELRHGFILQAETQEEQEGKFTLKWNKNY